MNHIEEVQSYWNSRAKGFSMAVEEELSTETGREWSAFFREHLPDCRLDILDDGTGAGFFAVLLSRMGHNVTAIDYSDQMIRQAKERFEALGLPVTAMQMDAQALQFPDASFDAVVSRNVLWNLDAPDQAYREIERVLRPGGVAIIDDGNMYLHLHNPAYAAAREKALKQSTEKEANLHARHNTDGVDFSVIETIAQELPMSSTLRPAWDFDQLVGLGFSDIRVQIRGGDLPMGFRIVARKRGASL